MPVILLAHRDPQLRASLGAALTSRGFEVIGVDSIDTALDAAAAGATGLLVELQLLADEDLEVKTRLDLRSGRATRILALTHKASAQEMSMLKRHGAGLLARSVSDVDRIASMLRIEEEPAAPWEGKSPRPSPAPLPKPASASKPMATAPKAPPASTIVPPPAPRPPPPPSMAPPPGTRAEPAVAAPWDDSANAGEVEVEKSSTFKPAPSQFMPPDLSKSVPVAADPKPEPLKPKPLPPPPQFMPPDLSKAPDPPPTPRPPPSVVVVDDGPTTAAVLLRAPGAPASSPAASLDDAKTTIGVPMAAPNPAPAPTPPWVSDDGPLEVPSDLFQTPDAPTGNLSPRAPPPVPAIAPPPPPMVPTAAPPPPPSDPPKAFTWGDETEDELQKPVREFDTDVFRDEAEEPTNNVQIPGAGPPKSDAISRAVAEALDDADSGPANRTMVSPAKKPPKVEVEAEAGSTGMFAIPVAGRVDSLAPIAPTAPPPAVVAAPAAAPPAAAPAPPKVMVEEGTQVIPDLAATPFVEKPVVDPFEPLSSETAVPDLSNISANVSPSWFDDDAVNRVDKVPKGSGPAVLVVEDEPAFRSFLKEALGAQGYQVHTAINGPNALRFLKQTPDIDLVISDLHMPHMDGFELKHEIDSILGRNMPFIVCTADASDEKIQIAAQVGAAALVPKPIENLDAFYAIIIDTLKDAGVLTRYAQRT